MVPDLQRQHQSLLQDLRKKLLGLQTAGHKFDPMGWPTKMLQTEPRYDLQPPALFSDTKVYPCLAQLLIRLTFYQVLSGKCLSSSHDMLAAILVPAHM